MVVSQGNPTSVPDSNQSSRPASPAPLIIEPASWPARGLEEARVGILSLQDGTHFQGISFGAERSISGECVFQTGMVGYSESLTDPSYRGQILVLTFPLIGNYGVPSRQQVDEYLNKLPLYFESEKIHVAALIVGRYSEDYSHFLAESSLGKWLKDSNIPALSGIDTRALTKKIRTQGVMLGKVLFPRAGNPITVGQLMKEKNDLHMGMFDDVSFVDPNATNLVAEVSTKKSVLYHAKKEKAIKNRNGQTLKVLAVDVGMKYNQIRCFTSRGVDVQVVPWDYDFVANTDYDGLFISNGPGDPTVCKPVIERLKTILNRQVKPVFGICLGHQLMALAAGAQTRKMKFGNRGHNIPCTDLQSGRCYITSQNHGYAVDAATLPTGWKELFVNANDGSNEGIMHTTLPYFSVQFHPESTPGPRDTEYLFEKFIDNIRRCDEAGKLVPSAPETNICKSQRVHVNKVLILGSGGLSIGQAGEFDYSGSQAIKALKEEGIYTVLINPNIATIQTSQGLADKVYFLPVTPEFVRKVIQYERPDGIYVSFGGQTALNVGIALKDEFAGLGVRVLGTPIETVILTEDRELFAQKMAEINEKCAASDSATNVKEALEVAKQIGYPVIARAAFTLGGLGSGFASNEQELTTLCNKAFAFSPQVLIEKSMKGWKEIEYEVVRDINDNCITVCNMENFDPLGIHTGDSIVVAPSQTLSDEDYNMLRTTAVNVIRHLGVVGECNIQYALNPDSKEYCIIEVNARLSRSSALASKATGYPLAFVAAKLGLGIPLSELKNSVTKVTCACFEPSLDYVVVKMPRWDLKKFNRVSTKVGSAMKSVGEVMAVGRNFEETIQKAIRSVDGSFLGFCKNNVVTEIEEELKNPSDQRLFALANALHDDKYTVDKLFELTKIDRWFLNKLKNLIDMEKKLCTMDPHQVSPILLKLSKQLGFSDRQLGKFMSTSEMAVRKIRREMNILPFVKQIDTVAAEFPSHTNYLYMTYNASEHDVQFDENGVMVLGSGVYRIGSSVEFDWCAVRTVRTLRKSNLKTIMVNFNPETVSTDYDEADRLYFENITLENVLDIYEIEGSSGVFVSMGGQTPNNIALSLHRENVKIYGTSPDQIDCAENRYKFSRMCDSIGVDQPRWKELTSLDEARTFCEKVGFPVLVRPSYVLSGAAMNVVYSPEDLENYLLQAVAVSAEHPVVISKFIEEAKEIEMDAVAKDGKLIYHVISEHVENAGVHSGDATLVLPPQDLQPETIKKIEDATMKIGNALNVTGPFNIQFIAKDNEIKVIECNLRASRSFPFCSKVMGVDMIELATKAMFGLPFEAYPSMSIPKDYVCVKVPQFSFGRLSGADPILGVEMASTGEVACFGQDKYAAYLKALISTGFVLPKKNILLSMGSFKEKQEFLPSVWKLHRLGYNLFATSGTADFISEHGIPVKCLETFEGEGKEEYSLTQHLSNHMIDLYINLPSRNRYRRPASYMSKGYRTRRMAVDLSVPLITNVKCAKLFVEALVRQTDFPVSNIDSQSSHNVVMLPGLVDAAGFMPTLDLKDSQSMSAITKAALSSGFTSMVLLPYGEKNAITSAADLDLARTNLKGDAHCDYVWSVVGTTQNADTLSDVASKSALFLQMNEGNPAAGSRFVTSLSDATKHFKNWPSSGTVIVQATGSQLASLIFMANMHQRSVHVTNVMTKEDMELIALSKRNGVQVTCDVPIYALFLSQKDVPGSQYLKTEADVNALWENMDSIDCFSTSALPVLLVAEHFGGQLPPNALAAGFEEAVPLLLTAVKQGRLSMKNVEDRLYHNPRRIFGIREQPATVIEIEVDRFFTVPAEGLDTAACGWSPFAGRRLCGKVSRVGLRGQPVYVDGRYPPQSATNGQECPVLASTVPGLAVSPEKPALTSRLSIRPTTPSAAPATTTDAHPLSPVSAAVAKSQLPDVIAETMKDALLDRDQRLQKALEKVEQMERSFQRDRERDLSLDRVTAFPPELARTWKSVFFRQHILTVKQFSRADLHLLFNAAHEMRTVVERHGTLTLLTGKILCNLFYEPSTRTSASFEAAMLRLGGQVLSIPQSTSSIQKGETLEDTVRTVGCYSDALVLRHPEPGSVNRAAHYSKVPVLNAGDGVGEHPTQAFLDVYTIREELGTVNGLTITLVGDLKHGRTVHSLVRLLSLYDGIRLNFVSPESLSLPSDVRADLKRARTQYTNNNTSSSNSSNTHSGLTMTEHRHLTPDLLSRTDVLYVTRIQKERFPTDQPHLYDQVKDAYRITASTLNHAKPTMIVMHPLPRVHEVDMEVDLDQRAAYFRQMRYGLFVRMALLALVLGGSGSASKE